MSTRTYFRAIRSIEPIREVVASGDDTLVNKLVVAYAAQFDEDEREDEPDEDDDPVQEFRCQAESMITCASAPKEEPGCWNYVIDLLSEHFDLIPTEISLSFNEGWKHYHVWNPYRDIVAKHVSAQSNASLRHLQDGRPLRGKDIDHDGCIFAWLAADEVTELHTSLSHLDLSLLKDDEWRDFHRTLVESLGMISSKSCALFMAAH